jgi:hypothetical protein
MMVWQRSCHGRCVRQRSRGATAEGFVAEKISSANFCLGRKGSCGSELFRSLSQGKVQDNSLCNVFRETECIL